MTIAVIGATGRIGRRLVGALRGRERSVAEISRSSGVNTLTREGLPKAVEGADVIVDVSGPPQGEARSSSPFFETSTRHLLAEAQAVGARHYVALSVVGIEGLTASPYFRDKQQQERLIAASGIPFTIVRSTQFFEFIADVVQDGDEREIRIAPALVQPIAADDIAKVLTEAVVSHPAMAVIEIAGPERMNLVDVASEVATAHEDTRSVIADPRRRYFGAEIGGSLLLPGPSARLGARRFDDWVRESLQPGARFTPDELTCPTIRGDHHAIF